MNRFLKNSYFIILILITLVTSGIKITPVSAQTGGSMQIVPLALPAGWTYAQLNGIWGSGADDVFAVGWGYNGSTLPLLYHKIGSSWVDFNLSLPVGWISATLNGVWGSGPSDVYLVGSGSAGGADQPLIYHWNGVAWTALTPLSPSGWGSGVLTGVWGSSASDIFAVGYGWSGTAVQPLIYHWNGVDWVPSTPSLPGGWASGNLYGVWGSSSTNVIAVGAGNNGSANWPMLYYWNGSTWTEANPSLPLPSGWTSGTLRSIWGFADNNVYAVGSGFDGSVNVPLLHQWNGSVWTASSLPSMPAGVNVGYLYGIWGSASTDIYAVGYGFKGTTKVPILYHKDSIGWNEASPVHPTGWTSDYLYGVWGSSFNDVNAVGSGHNGSVDMPLLYHSSAVGQDLLAPGNVTNLAATTGTSSSSVKLSWTAPADDAGNNGSGSVASYLVKYSLTPFTSWADGAPVTTGLPVPAAPGTAQTMLVSGLSPNTVYHFAVRAQDEQYNLSAEPVPVASATSSAVMNSTWYIGGVGAFDFGMVGDIPVMADYNGDGRADIAVFRPSNGTWYIGGVGSFLYGTMGDIPVVADYNGDGKDDIAIFRPSESKWYIAGVGVFAFGTTGDIPVVADYNGDGKADIAIFRPSTSTWYIGGVGAFPFGIVGDIPVIADYNGDGKADIAIFRPSESTWYVGGVGVFPFGIVGDIPVVADYNGDGKADIAIFRPSESIWYVGGVGVFPFGITGDIPVIADYNGDGRADIAVFRP